MILNKRIGENSRERIIISPRNPDPFENMIHKKNQSPILKPVRVNLKQYLLRSSNSLPKIMQITSLPPISLTYRKGLNLSIPDSNRNGLMTPRFTISDVIKNREFKSKSEAKYLDISFGDKEEKAVRSKYVIPKNH